MPRTPSILSPLAVLLVAACTTLSPAQPRPPTPAAGATDAPLHFALMGDQQYTPQMEAAFLRVMQEVDAAPVDFVLHVGDIKASYAPCSDELLAARRAQFDRSAHPFILLFGDNEWTDCNRTGGDPLERLAFLRKRFAATDESLGQQRMPLTRQREAGFPENVRWERAGVLFLGLNVPGSNNNAAFPGEMRARDAATLAWLREGFRLARERGMRAVLVAFHANPGFVPAPGCPPLDSQYTEFTRLLEALAQEATQFGKPVVLVHGDSHCFQVDRPLKDPTTGKPVPNVTRVEVIGDPHTGWVRATMDPSDPALFRFTPVFQR